MTAPALYIPLRDAYLCECGLIGSSAIRCACGNAHGLLCLSTVLNRGDEPSANPERVARLLDALEEACA